VLIYVADKQAAFAEFARILRPAGRISLFEPINRFAQRSGSTWMGNDLTPLGEAGAKVLAVYERLQPPDTDPMLDFDERDLIRLAEESGFFPIHAHLEAEISPREPLSWQSFLAASGNPNIPTFAEAMEQALTPEEQERVSEYLRPLVEEGRGEWRMATLHLAATRR
jgi:SAM-dependent methyltransferase